jgi:ubiquinone/menaquinone biosynthesis C-methylase UbiE
MGGLAAYDGIADWYATQFLPSQVDDPLSIERSLRLLLGTGRGVCLEVGCGTGVYARPVRELGWTPVGVDVSAAVLRYADGRLPVTRADAGLLPVRTRRVPAAIAVMAHTDMPGYPAVLGEVSRVLAAGGVFVHIGVHPCFSGGFADRTDPEAVIIRPGYLNTYWTRDSYSDKGLRHKVGAMHRPMSQLLNLVLDAGLVLERFAEGGEPTPIMFALRARKPA